MNGFHGTSIDYANVILGPPLSIDVTKGGGELGRGFYLGESVALASSWSKGKYNSKGVVIKFEINDSSFVKLTIKVINRWVYVYYLWKSLIIRNKSRHHLFNFDVICAPFATIDFSYQYKFESVHAQNTLNNNSIAQIL